jgi:hypothetical protein
MIRALRELRLSRSQLTAVASASVTATVLVIVNATGSTALDRAVVAVLARHVVIRHTLAPAPPASSIVGGSTTSGRRRISAGKSGRSVGASSGSSRSGAGPGASSAGGLGLTGGTTTTTTSPPTTTTTPAARPGPKLKHVFVIALSTPSYTAAFGKGSPARYLNGTLRKHGTLLSHYETLAHGSELADELAMVSGQAPNADTGAGCQTFSEFPATAKAAADGNVAGTGCVYPNTALTIGDQITGAGRQWRAYIDDMGSAPCVHPDSNAADSGQLPGAGPEYDTRHNPFIYFHSLLDLGDCASDDLALARLPTALAKPSAKAPAFVYIAPGACEDAVARTCPGGAPAGLAGEDAFLKTWVARIERSRAYRDGGALVIAFGTPTSPQTRPAGALLLSRHVAAGRTVATGYDPYSVLRTVEDLFAFTPLAHAKTARSFADLLTKGS